MNVISGKSLEKTCFMCSLKHNSHYFSFFFPSLKLLLPFILPFCLQIAMDFVMPPKTSFNVKHLLHIEIFQPAGCSLLRKKRGANN